MRTDVKVLPLEGQLPLSAQPAKQTGDGPVTRSLLAQVERKRSKDQLLSHSEGRGVIGMGDIKRVPFEGHRGIDP